MADLYADQVASIGDRIKTLQGQQVQNYDDMAETITSKYQKVLSGYDTKWKSVQDAGEEDIAGILGAKGVYASYKKVKEGFKNIGKKKKPDAPDGDDTNTPDTSAPDGSAGSGSGAGNNPNANAQQQAQPDADASTGGGGPDAPDPALGGGGGGGGAATTTPDATITPGTTTAPNPQARPDEFDYHPEDLDGDLMEDSNLPLASLRGGAGPATTEEAEGFFRGIANRFYQAAGQKGQQLKSFFNRSAGDTAGDAAGGEAATAAAAGTDAAAAGGSGVATTFTTGEAVLGAIPGVGEIALAVGGLVAIGEGIYHLFHHPKAPAAPPEIAPLQAPQQLLMKYSAALPSVDSSVDRAASVSSF